MASPPVAEAAWTASSTAHCSCWLMVKPAKRPSTACPSSVSTISLLESGTRLTQTSTLAIYLIRSLVGSRSGVASTEPTVTG